MYDNVPGYRMEVDMWACGVIMYTLLCGAPPFWHRKQMQMLRMIMQANYAFGSPEWDDISQTAKDLVKHLHIQFVDIYKQWSMEVKIQGGNFWNLPCRFPTCWL